MGRITWATAAGGATVSHENWERYTELRVPVLAIHGTADRATEPEGSRRFVELIASQDKTLHLMEGALHAPLDDTARDEALQTMLTWLGRRLPPT